MKAGKIVKKAYMDTDLVATKNEQICYFVITLICLTILLIIYGLYISGGIFFEEYTKKQNAIDFAVNSVGVFVFSSVFIFIIWSMPFSEPIIFENGISSNTHSFFDFLRGYTFHPFENITTIGYGTHFYSKEKKQIEFIVIYEQSRPNASTSFRSIIFKDDFLNMLKKTLKEKSPNAKWVETDFNSLSWWLRH